MKDSEHESRPAPWHRGERTLQERLGVAERMDQVGRKVIRDYMPDQHRTFFGQLPFLVLGTVDASGAPWASVVEGIPGFVASPDPKLLHIGAWPTDGDPACDVLALGAAVGLLGIEPHTRRRNRMNGNVTAFGAGGFDVAVCHSFGNCPKYILPREISLARPPSPRFEGARGRVERAHALNEAARAWIAAADTFFVASYVDVDGDPARRAVDVSHRGGPPGFLRVDGDVLTIPDFAGNLHFNTLGNLIMNPRAGLLFIDFDTGSTLQLTGAVDIVLEGDDIASFPGAERLWRFKVEEVLQRRDALALRGRPASI